MQPGKVYLVGAGPGHPELLTLKAASLLKSCDVVVYDRLIQEEVLALAKPSAERLYMGKPVGRHDSRQPEANDLLVRKAREGKTVVRLKGGDPYVFGRGGEEAEYLADRGVPFEVIPGVTSAFSAPLSAGIPVTHREAASSVAVVTGHEASKDHERVNWRALTGIDTLVFLMGVSNSGRIADTLIRHGKDPETPAAMIQMAFWHDERAVTATLGTIAKVVEEEGIRPPATFVVGDVVLRRERLAKAERDLRRRADGSSRFEPAPAPDQLLRLALAGLGSQVLGYSLEQKLFDHLEGEQSASTLASELALDESATAEILESLVALAVLEKKEGGYGNLELASRYLRSNSPESLRDAILHQASLATNWDELRTYAKNGCKDLVLIPDEHDHHASSESLARFSAPSVAEKLDLGRAGQAHLIGYGGEAYKQAISERWPNLAVTASNPFENTPPGLTNLEPAPEGKSDAIILSGLLASASTGEIQQLLESATKSLTAGGLLVLHDAFLPAGVLPPPEVVLGSLGRRIHRGGCRSWSLDRLQESLKALGFAEVTMEPLPAGTILVTARR